MKAYKNIVFGILSLGYIFSLAPSAYAEVIGDSHTGLDRIIQVINSDE
jgi:hypothetical protein